MRYLRLVWITGIVFFFFLSPLQAAELGSVVVESGGSVNNCLSFSPRVDLNPGDDPEARLFEYLVLTPGDVGQTYTIASNADDPDFSKMAQALVNGIDDQIGLGRFFAYTSNPESFWFGKTPDFQGNQVSSITLRLENLNFSEPDDRQYCDLSFRYVITVYGAPPAAESVPTLSEWGMILFSLLISGMAFVYMRRRKEMGMTP